jgi:hypothetical protein
MTTTSNPLTGSELIPMDTQAASGQMPETYAGSVTQIAQFAASGPSGGPAVATADNGSSQTLTAAMIGVANKNFVSHLSTGGSTPSLTLPTVAALLAAFPGLVANSSYVLRVINSNSGTATIVTNTGWTTSGTLTLATNTTRDFVVQITSVSAATANITSIGTGTNS